MGSNRATTLGPDNLLVHRWPSDHTAAVCTWLQIPKGKVFSFGFCHGPFPSPLGSPASSSHTAGNQYCLLINQPLKISPVRMRRAWKSMTKVGRGGEGTEPQEATRSQSSNEKQALSTKEKQITRPLPSSPSPEPATRELWAHTEVKARPPSFSGPTPKPQIQRIYFYLIKIKYFLFFTYFLIFISFIWLHRLFVAAYGIFDVHCSMPESSCNMWDLVPWPGIEPRPVALEAKSWPLDHQGSPPRIFFKMDMIPLMP